MSQGWQKASDREDMKDLVEVKSPGKVASVKNEETNKRHSTLMGLLEDEKQRQSEWRMQMAIDEDFKDALQWTVEDAVTLLDRTQAPLVFNKIKPVIKWISGTEKRTRFDSKILPREEGDDQSAEVKQKIFKYLSDVNHDARHRSRAFEDAISGGLGWLESGISLDPSDELIYGSSESWRNIFHDSRSRQDDMDDARYLFRCKVLDNDIVRALFPEFKGETNADKSNDQDDIWYLGQRLTSSTDLDVRNIVAGSPRNSAYISSGSADIGRRDVVRLIEAWYKVPMPVKYIRGGEFDGKEYNGLQHGEAIKRGEGSLSSSIKMQMRVMIMTESEPLWDGPSPYSHNKFPFTPIWCYRRARDGAPYGVIRDLRSPQEDYNKRASKALHILSTNRVIMEKGAVDDIEELRAEAAANDGVIITNPGKELRIEQDKALAREHLMLMEHDAKMIQDVAGVTDENMGKRTNATSGVAIQSRQDQGTTITADLFDNLRHAVQLHGEKRLSLMEQFFTAPKVVRIAGEKNKAEWIKVNNVDPVTGEIVNDITASKADFIISEQDYRASMRQAMFEETGDILGKMLTAGPVGAQVAASVLDLWIDMADVPNREEWVKRIRQVNGQKDPNDMDETPQEDPAAQMQQMQAEQQAQANQLQGQKVAAETDKLTAEAELKRAQIQKMFADQNIEGVTYG